jgi:hypothetical protein
MGDSHNDPLRVDFDRQINQPHQHRKLTQLILDMDSSVSETYGHLEGSAYNGYFACTCYHPLFLFHQFGDLEPVMLRRGNHSSAKFWRRVLLPVIERYRDRDIPKYFRGDAAFALPKLLRWLEQEGFRYAIRIKANPVLERKIAHLLRRPVGRPFMPRLCLGVRLPTLTTGSESRRRPSAVCPVGGLRALNEGGTSGAVGSGGDDAASGGVLEG